jgi:uncharacterized protein YijF (DUF1287 family)
MRHWAAGGAAHLVTIAAMALLLGATCQPQRGKSAREARESAAPEIEDEPAGPGHEAEPEVAGPGGAEVEEPVTQVEVDDARCLDPAWTDEDMEACLERWTEVQCQILEGAHIDAQNAVPYFLANLYLKTNYFQGEKQKKTLKKWGDIPPDKGVCTDTVIRSLRHAGIDLQQLVYKDVKKDEAKKTVYPWGKWKKTKADTNIDHRRCPILETFFQRKALNLSLGTGGEDLESWEPGDIVYWDLQTGRYHIGVVSDTKGPSGMPRVFHNYPDPGYVCEEDALDKFLITGHFRYPQPGDPKPKSPPPAGYSL